jgi:hypothetical protein
MMELADPVVIASFGCILLGVVLLVTNPENYKARKGKESRD